MNPEIERRLQACKTLPTLPSIAGEIVRLCRDERSSLNALAALLAKDPALAARLLSIANAPMFAGRAGQATTISQSVGRLGKNAVLTLSLSFSLARLTTSRSATFDYARYWKRSLIAATAARVCAELLGLKREEAFLGAMFQDIGMLALHEVVGDPYTTLIAPAAGNHFELAQLESEAMESDHREVGAWLVRRWNLPDYLYHTTLGSHGPAGHEAPGELEGLVSAVALSGCIADIWLDEAERPSATRQAADCAGAWLGIAEDKFIQLLDRVSTTLPELARLFDVGIAPEAAEATLREAKDALVAVSLKSALDAENAQHAVADLARETQEVRARANLDALTGVYNRGYFDTRLARAFEDAVSSGAPLSVVFCDVDHFKQVNDNYGHPAGDAVLRAVGELLGHSAADSEVAARYGGEEFAIILPDTPLASAVQRAERLRGQLEQLTVRVQTGRTVRVTASFGCATRDARVRAISPAALLKIADECVYAAKRAGRNRVVSF